MAPLPRPPVRLALPCFLVQSALFNLADLITVLLLLICICTYIRGYRKGIFDVEDGTHRGLRGGKLARSYHSSSLVKLTASTFLVHASSDTLSLRRNFNV